SPITCRYLQAVCLEAAGDAAGAAEAYRKVEEITVRRYGGRVVSSEQYVLRKLKTYKEEQKNGVKGGGPQEAGDAVPPAWLTLGVLPIVVLLLRSVIRGVVRSRC